MPSTVILSFGFLGLRPLSVTTLNANGSYIFYSHIVVIRPGRRGDRYSIVSRSGRRRAGGNGKTAVIGIDLANDVSEIIFSWRANTMTPPIQTSTGGGMGKISCERRIITNGVIYVNTLYGALAADNRRIW